MVAALFAFYSVIQGYFQILESALVRSFFEAYSVSYLYFFLQSEVSKQNLAETVLILPPNVLSMFARISHNSGES